MTDYSYQIGGTLKLDDPCYVKRQADSQLYKSLLAGKFCYVLNSRQMGKSSLRIRTTEKLKKEGVACADIDLQEIGANVTQAEWYGSIIDTLINRFRLEEKFDLETWWDANSPMSPVWLLSKFIGEVLLECIRQPLVIFIDEIDYVLSLSFSVDDFFGLIRYFYNKRADNAAYDRLAFALFGVATPGDLIKDTGRTPFNIGTAIELNGFEFEEALILAEGFKGKIENPEQVLKEILFWTGGQPFLTQKLCKLCLVELESKNYINVSKLVESKIIDNWEAQDEPMHLRTIRDRLLRNEKTAGRILGIYQQILTNFNSSFKNVTADSSDEQKKLRLSGLVVKKNGSLLVYNPIYAAVFNQDWINKKLDKLRPYSEAIKAWLDANYDSSWLLRGKALEEALAWKTGKSLSVDDDQFLTASQELEKREVERDLAAQKQANQILAEAKLRADEEIRAAKEQLAKLDRETKAKITKAKQQLEEARDEQAKAQQMADRARSELAKAEQTRKTALLATRLEQAGANALRQFEFRQIEALVLAMEAALELKKLVKNHLSLPEYPAISPVCSLLIILANLHEHNQLEGHQGIVTSVSYSPDGKTIASGSEDGKILLWRKNGTLLTTLSGHTGEVNSVVFSPDGKIIASGSLDHTVRLWKRDGSWLTTLMGHGGKVNSVVFSPDGKIIASGSEDGTVKLWELDGTLITTFTEHRWGISSLGFSPKGEILASGGWEGTVTLWKLDGSLRATLIGHHREISSVAFSPTGEAIASGSFDNTVKLWKLDGTLINTFTGHSGEVTCVVFSPDGQNIASGSFDSTVKLWQLDGTLINTFTGHSGWVTSLAYSPNGKIIASASEDKTIKLWKCNSTMITTLKGHSSWVESVAYSPDGKMIASGSIDSNIKLWQPNGKVIAILKGYNALVSSVVFSPDGKIIASGSDDGHVLLWNTNGNLKKTLVGHLSWVSSVSFSADGKIIASGSEDGTILLWQQDGTLITTLKGHQGSIRSLAFTPQSCFKSTLVSGSEDGTVKLWQSDGTLITTLTGHRGGVNSVVFSPNGNVIASGSYDRTVKLWKKNDGSLITTLTGHGGIVTSVAFSPDGQMIASGSVDRTVKLWKPDGTEITTLTGHSDRVTCVAFSPSGEAIASSSWDGTVILWSLNLDDLLEKGSVALKDYFMTRHSLVVG
ncbi:MAG: AAA-like domain-containing protein [Gomphosphaeria aponina SAG 52.96 = DSM 107014]|uniref:AAA-like domain-containing protein n=1 Tax=Gomphosphaeria aponina SAG 52.96 = DSM 107014 TaxID=1521640 RepID=A0A941GV84_9CHRO|nr:AAA-like domain-containing protein [Gomphosphaeria aponina SAG 52.96 = DSM 107014]